MFLINNKKKLKKYMKCWQLYLLILPAVVLTLVFSYQPMYGVLIAFENYKAKDGIWGSEWVGLEHFIRFVKYPDFWKLIKNTLRISIYEIALFPISIILALLINELNNAKFKKTVQMITYAPYFLSSVVVCGIVTMLVDKEGAIGVFFEMLTGKSVNLMTVPEYFPSIYVWSGVWQGAGWGTIIYLAALSNVPSELIEAAKIDGASRFQVIWHVNIPSILSTIVICLIMSLGGILGVGFEKIYLLQNDLNLETSRIIATYTYEIGLIGGQLSYSTAIGLFNNIVNIVVIVMVNKVMDKLTGIGIW